MVEMGRKKKKYKSIKIEQMIYDRLRARQVKLESDILKSTDVPVRISLSDIIKKLLKNTRQ